MHIKLDINELTLDDMEALEGAKFNPDRKVWQQMRELLARFAFESDAPDAKKIPYEDALKRVGTVSFGRIQELVAELKTGMKEGAEQAIPPTISEESSQPLEE